MVSRFSRNDGSCRVTDRLRGPGLSGVIGLRTPIIFQKIGLILKNMEAEPFMEKDPRGLIWVCINRSLPDHQIRFAGGIGHVSP